MDMFHQLVLNLILVLFPILVYFLYHCYKELCMEKYNGTMLGVALVSSVYLCLKFGNIHDDIFTVMFCNIPIIVAYLKKQSSIGVILSFVVIGYAYTSFSLSFVLCVFKLLCYFIIYIIGKKKQIKDSTFVLAVVVIQGFFVSFDYVGRVEMGTMFSFHMIISMLFFYFFPFFLLYLFRLTDGVTRLYSTVLELERDKQLKNSLFKITHEVKNPIAVCKGYLDMMDVNDSNQVKQYVPVIKEEIGRSLDIMNDFMEFSKIKIEKDLIDINLLLEDVFHEFHVLFNSKKICFDSHIINDEVYVNGDYNRLKQVFVNLLKNSMEAIEGNGHIQIFTHILKNKYYIEIIDNGIGMDEDVISRIKEMFYTTKKNGSGLGVSLSNEIIKAHDGSIDYFSRVGKGTKVVVKIPIVML